MSANSGFRETGKLLGPESVAVKAYMVKLL
jgi:hypothetical protein